MIQFIREVNQDFNEGTIKMAAYEFDGEKYKQASRHQKEWGNNLISQLHLSGAETVLDLGYGDGALSERKSYRDRCVSFILAIVIMYAGNYLASTENAISKLLPAYWSNQLMLNENGI